jgi:hypothetical protein
VGAAACGSGASGAEDTIRGATTVAATVFSLTVLGVTTTLLTSLPVFGSDRTTDVMRLDCTGFSAAGHNPATSPPSAIIEQNRIKMFSNPANLTPAEDVNSNGIISV